MSHAHIDFSKLTVLVVDDSTFMCNLIEAILESYGCTNVVLAGGVTQALRKLDDRPIDFAFVDWYMEPLQGLEFVRRVRAGADGPNPYLPIIMLTGHSEADRVRQARDTGVNDFLVKPVSGESVYRRIVSLVEDTRSFIKTSSFLGPDRRRTDMGPPEGVKERRQAEGSLRNRKMPIEYCDPIIRSAAGSARLSESTG